MAGVTEAERLPDVQEAVLVARTLTPNPAQRRNPTSPRAQGRALDLPRFQARPLTPVQKG